MSIKPKRPEQPNVLTPPSKDSPEWEAWAELHPLHKAVVGDRPGKAVIALPSTAQGGKVSRIVGRLSPGAGVVTTRGDVHYVVTEFGAAYLHGKSIQERALAMISIAHPKFQAKLLQKGEGLVEKLKQRGDYWYG